MESGTRKAIRLSDAVAKEIRVLLVRRDMKQAELATLMGVGEMWLSRRLRGAQPLDLNDVQRIATALNVEVIELLPREKQTVAISGSSERQATVAKKTLANQPHPFVHSQHGTPKSAIRRPVFLHQ